MDCNDLKGEGRMGRKKINTGEIPSSHGGYDEDVFCDDASYCLHNSNLPLILTKKYYSPFQIRYNSVR